ncbi:MAG: glycosyltransferase family 2 protein [Thermodesulfobacteriota bacterium]|nr:glycosyltransferase family 2 protein [Thermodesulfobacteriota bacterium]
MKRVSVIIVNFNGAHYLKDLFSSLESVDYPRDKLEIIVFDNGSIDNSCDVIKSDCPGATILKSDHNIGFARPHKIAAEEATGDVLAFLNNDMKVDPRWIKEGVAHLNRAEGVVCASSKIFDWTGDNIDFCGGTLHYLGFADQLHGTELNDGQEILFPCGGAMFIDKAVFKKVGCFDDDYFAIFEDVDLGWRLWVIGYRVVIATESIVYHRGHGTLDTQRETKKRYLMHRNAMMTIIKNYDGTNLKRILPLSLIFAVKRALLFMGVDKKQYYFWEENNGSGSSEEPDNFEEGCIHLAALDDVIGDFKRIVEKRNQVQSMRKRSDGDIFTHFKDPFRNIMGYREYLWDEVALFGAFSLDCVFNCKEEYRNREEEAMYHVKEQLYELIPEVRGSTNKRKGENIIVIKEFPRENIWAKVLNSLKNQGVITTCKKGFSRLL